jgi:hypothetical protein
MTALAFIDTETTGLDPERHEMWEFAAILADHHDGQLVVTDTVHLDLPVTRLHTAEPMALQIGGYYSRRDARTGRMQQTSTPTAPAGAQQIASTLAGRHLVSANPSFDAAFIRAFLTANGQAPCWPHHLIDVTPLVAGYIQGVAQAQHDAKKTAARHDDVTNLAVPPYRSRDLADAIDVTIDDTARHTAVGDARWALDQYATVYALQVIDHDA